MTSAGQPAKLPGENVRALERQIVRDAIGEKTQACADNVQIEADISKSAVRRSVRRSASDRMRSLASVAWADGSFIDDSHSRFPRRVSYGRDDDHRGLARILQICRASW